MLKLKGFTLAEVLITLMIIGIVAAMTIPTLMKNTQDVEFRAAMKKNYSIFSGLYSRIQLDSGGNFADAFSNCASDDDTCFKNVIKPYFSYIKECDSNNTTGICFPSRVYQMDNTLSNSNFHNDVASGLILKDGTMAIFHFSDPNCGTVRGTFTNECSWMTIDGHSF